LAAYKTLERHLRRKLLFPFSLPRSLARSLSHCLFLFFCLAFLFQAHRNSEDFGADIHGGTQLPPFVHCLPLLTSPPLQTIVAKRTPRGPTLTFEERLWPMPCDNVTIGGHLSEPQTNTRKAWNIIFPNPMPGAHTLLYLRVCPRLAVPRQPLGPDRGNPRAQSRPADTRNSPRAKAQPCSSARFIGARLTGEITPQNLPPTDSRVLDCSPSAAPAPPAPLSAGTWSSALTAERVISGATRRPALSSERNSAN
jgi:hypothetical protein